MIITAVERAARRRGRVEVYVDGVAAFEVAADVARQRGLRPGSAIEQGDVDAIVAADRRRRALETAVTMLARRPRSELEVRRRLARSKVAPSLVEETMERLRSLKFLDDAAFARAWTESRDRASPRGWRLIVRELRACGVDAGVAAEAAASVSDEDAAYRAASRRMRALAGCDYASFRSRLGSYLQRRGFGWEVSRQAVERCWRERGGADAGIRLTATET